MAQQWKPLIEGELVPFEQVQWADELMVNGKPVSAYAKPPGAIRLYMDVWCGGANCDKWEHLESTKRREAAAEARSKGWRLTRARGWLCPDCQRELADQSEEG